MRLYGGRRLYLWATFGSEGIHLALSLHDGLLDWRRRFGQAHQVRGGRSQSGQCILERLLVFLDLGSFPLLRLTFLVGSSLVGLGLLRRCCARLKFGRGIFFCKSGIAQFRD